MFFGQVSDSCQSCLVGLVSDSCQSCLVGLVGGRYQSCLVGLVSDRCHSLDSLLISLTRVDKKIVLLCPSIKL